MHLTYNKELAGVNKYQSAELYQYWLPSLPTGFNKTCTGETFSLLLNAVFINDKTATYQSSSSGTGEKENTGGTS